MSGVPRGGRGSSCPERLLWMTPARAACPASPCRMTVYRPTRDHVAATTRSLGPGPWTYADLRSLGWTARQLESAVGRGALQRLRLGVYDTTTPDTARPVADLQAARMRAILAALHPRAVLSHESAARLHGMWLPLGETSVVHVTVPGQPERRATGLRVHGSRLPESLVVTRQGLRVTTVARTAVDLARGLTLPHALVAVDGAVHRSIALRRPDADVELRRRAVPAADLQAARDELERAYDSVWTWPGTRVVRAALDLADPASESPFESWSRGWMVAVGLPRPVVNAEVVGASGAAYAGDFVWRSRRVIGEADGLGKYGRSERELREALRAERVRQADLEAAGWRLVRWTTGEPGRTVVARLARALYLPANAVAEAVPDASNT